MEQTYLVNAIILDKMPWREHDTRVFLYTREAGRLELVVRGAKKPESKLAGRMEPFAQVEAMVVAGKQFNYVGGVSSGQSYTRLNSDYDKIRSAGRMAAMALKLTREGPADQALYNLLCEFLALLDQASDRAVQARFLALAGQLKMLSVLGLLGDSHYCATCAVSLRDSGWFLPSGEIVCRSCKPLRPLRLAQDGEAQGRPIGGLDSMELGPLAIRLLQQLTSDSFEQAIRSCKLDKEAIMKLEQVIATISLNQQ